MKRCGKCGVTKPLTEFYVSKSKGKPHSYCRPCLSAYRKRWDRENPEEVRAIKRRYREAHREQVREEKRRYYAAHREKMREQQRVWRELNPDRVMARNQASAEKRRWQALARDHGLTPDAFLELWRQQDGRCAICRRQLAARAMSRKEAGSAGSPQSHVDHCHKTGRIRGLLCLHCNHGLGNFRDDVAALRRAAEYLEDPPAFASPSP